MIPAQPSLLYLLSLIDEIWVDPPDSPRRGAPWQYPPQTLFKVYIVGCLRRLPQRRGLWRYLRDQPDIQQACDLARLPDRRTLDRRLSGFAAVAERQIQALGLVLCLEQVTDPTHATTDGSACATPGPVWHKKDKAAGRLPDKLRRVDRQADWIQSSYHGWVYGYKVHATLSIAPTTVRVVFDATVTGSACESHILHARLHHLPPLIRWLLLDAGYDDQTLLAACHQRGLKTLVPLSKPIGASTSADRRQRAEDLASQSGRARYALRRQSIEPFFATLKAIFHLDPLPVQGKAAAQMVILAAVFCWNLIVLFNALAGRPLGAVKSVLEAL
jgi:hypothetical protein